MLIYEKEIFIPSAKNHSGLLEHVSRKVSGLLSKEEIPVRFVITRTDDNGYHCELGILSKRGLPLPETDSIFEFRKRAHENVEQFNAVLIIPTGIGAEIGGHSGDGGPVARLLASACDNLITHPNVVNASDINELPENAFYVEGSIITRLLMGTIGLQKVRSNRVMVVAEKHRDFSNMVINMASAARASAGIDCPRVIMIDDFARMKSEYSSSGRASGRIEDFSVLYKMLVKHRNEYDAVALSSVIDTPHETRMDYYRGEGSVINPWGGVEAMLTHSTSHLLNVPSAHSPMLPNTEVLNLDLGIIDPRMAAEDVSITFLFSILKGLHRSPRIISNPVGMNPGVLTVSDISCLIIPDRCVGLPVLAALEHGIPVIAVRENRNRMGNNLEELPFPKGKLFIAENYLEAAGIMNALKSGISPGSVRRPLEFTRIEDKG